MRGSRKFCQRGSNFDDVFVLDEAREDPNTTIVGAIIGPPAKPMMAQYIDCWLGGFVIFRGSETVLLRDPIFFSFSRGGGPNHLFPLDPRMPTENFLVT